MTDLGETQAHEHRTAEESCHCTLLRKASRRVSALYDRALEPTGLRITQFALLAEIERSGPLTITDLAKAMAMDRNGLGHNLRLLERGGLLATVPGKDRRSREVSLSATGRQRLAAAKPHWRAAQQRLTKSGMLNELRQPLSILAASDLGLP